MLIYLFDGSFGGLLNCIFRAYQFKDRQVTVTTQQHYQPRMFDDTVEICTDEARAQRVWAALCRKISSSSQRSFYRCYLSEQAAAFQALFDYAHYVFDHARAVDLDYGHPAVLAVSQFAKQVGREKHRVEAFVRFKKTAEGIFFASINPDFNVLPLAARHFRLRYADQRWLIYDDVRKYGIYYDLQQVQEVSLNLAQAGQVLDQYALSKTSMTLDAKEALYDQLWRDYFKSTNIVARQNIKLHVQSMPKRYWAYLNEKCV
jgi:probable DNA metabolism protein